MAIYIVKQGDCLSSIARDHGFSDWRTIYDHAENADFRARRPDPNLIFPKDRLFIPDREAKQEAAATEAKHRFVAVRQETFLNLKLEEAPGEPMAGDYVLDVGGSEHRGSLDAEGRLSHKIPPDAKKGELRVLQAGLPEEDALRWEIEIGALDPLDELSGVQGRIWNLGIDCGPVDNLEGPRTKTGVKTFQKLAFRDPDEWDGIAGDKTKAKLEEHHEL